MIQNKIQLFKKGQVQTKNGREFTRLVGGFGEDKPMFTIFQASELLGIRTGDIRDNFERNEDNFENGIDYIDLKLANGSNVSEINVDITSFLKSVGYSQNKLNATKRWLAFSFSGMMKLVKIATTKESWEVYNDFLEDYFKAKAENKIMKETLEDTREKLIEHKKFILGSMFVEQDDKKKMEYFNQAEKINNQITEITKAISEQEVYEKLKDSVAIADKFTNSDNLYDIGNFAKILDIKDLGRNKLFSWLRNNEILMANNVPYQRYSEYFKIIPLEYNGHITSKTLLKGNGIPYIVKKLIKDNKIITKSYEEVIKELDKNLTNVA